MLIDTGCDGFTAIVMEFEVAGFPVGQFMFEVSWQVITSPFIGL
jgi:hypothetical protein